MVSRLPLNLQTKHLFYQERPTSYRLPKIVLFTEQMKHFFGDVYRNKQRGVARSDTRHNFDKSILFQTSNPLPHSNFGRGYGGHILSRKPILYPEFSCRSRPGCMPPGFQSRPRITRPHRADGLGVETFLA